MFHIRTLLAILISIISATAQIVTVANYSTWPWSGYVRTTVDRMPPHSSGWLLRSGQFMAGQPVAPKDAIYRLGRRVGEATWVLDLWCELAPSQKRTFDLGAFDDCEIPVPGLPADVFAHFGAWLPEVNGNPLTPLTIQVDGAAILVQLRARVPGSLLVCDLWLWWRPEEPWVCHGEALITASNPTVPDVVEDAPAVTLVFGDAVIQPLGAPVGQLAPATHWADGQSRGVPLTFSWPRHLPRADWSQPWGDDEWRWIGAFMSTEAAKVWQPTGVGIEKLLQQGNPLLPPGFAPIPWANGRLPGAVAALYTWDVGTAGPVKTSGDTGAQTNEQFFVRGEALLPGGAGAEQIAYLGALKHADRPCHHREADGSPLDPSRHTSRPLIFWQGRPHSGLWNLVDRLGKPEPITSEITNGWFGPDPEHWFFPQLAAGTRYTGSPCLQALLRNQALIYPLQWTTQAGWSTSQPYASRAVGWEMLAAVALWRDLEDRQMADRVRVHNLARWTTVIAPTRSGDVWDWRTGDARFPPGGSWWIPSQQAIEAYGLDLAGETFGVPAMRETALRGALKVLDAAIFLGTDGRYFTVKSVCDDGRVDPWGGYWLFGTPMAVATVLRQQPNHARARAIWIQMVQDATQPEQTSWLSPGI